jgi:hypothetical protein
LPSDAQAKKPRIALRKLFAACGFAARRSRPARIVSAVMAFNGTVPAVAMTLRNTFSRWRRVALASAAQAELLR